MCERLLANPLIEDYEIDARLRVRTSRRGGGVRFGVVRFPGSCDEVDALLACRRFGDAELLWHKDRDLGGVDAVVVPGGFSYGDYLRAGAIARFSPADGVGDRVRARRRPRARHLQRLPGAVRGGPAAGRPAAEPLAALRLPPGGRRRGEPRHPVHARVRGRATCSRSRSSTPPGATTRPGIPERAGRAALRAGAEPERGAGRHRRRVQRGGQRARADAAPRARGRPADRLRRRRPAVRVARLCASWRREPRRLSRRTASSA